MKLNAYTITNLNVLLTYGIDNRPYNIVNELLEYIILHINQISEETLMNIEDTIITSMPYIEVARINGYNLQDTQDTVNDDYRKLEIALDLDFQQYHNINTIGRFPQTDWALINLRKETEARIRTTGLTVGNPNSKPSSPLSSPNPEAEAPGADRQSRNQNQNQGTGESRLNPEAETGNAAGGSQSQNQGTETENQTITRTQNPVNGGILGAEEGATAAPKSQNHTPAGLPESCVAIFAPNSGAKESFLIARQDWVPILFYMLDIK